MSEKKKLEKKNAIAAHRKLWGKMFYRSKEDRRLYKQHRWKMRKLARKLSEDEIIEYIKTEDRDHLGGVLYEYLRKPSERISLAQVQFYGCDIKAVKNQSDEIKWAAIKETPWAIRYVKNATEDMMEYAVLKEPDVLDYIRKPTHYIRLIGRNT